MMDLDFSATPRWVGARGFQLLFLVWIACSWLPPQLVLGQAGRDEVLEGNSFFAEGRFDEAHDKYQQALDQDPSSAAIRYNLGDAEYKRNLYEEAIEAFSQAMQTEEPELQARASYNLGNALYRLGKLEDSIQAYQDALRIDPSDRDSKHNLEFVKSKLEEQEQQQKQQEKEDDQDQQDQENQDQSQNEQGNQDQNQDGEQEQDTPEDQVSDKNQPEQQKDQGEEQAEQQQQDSGSEQADSRSIPKMSREEAERLLEALNESGNELKKKKLKTKGRVPVEKDW